MGFVRIKHIQRRSQAGFTLVELMIVVAIIGILASIAIPNYQKYQSKARTAEGKIELAAAYTAQKSFYVEYSSYTGCLASAGYAPDLGTANNTIRYYAVGFNAASAGAACGPAGGQACEAGSSWGNGAATCTSGTDGTNLASIGTYWSATRSANTGAANTNVAVNAANLPTTTATATTFIVGAAGNINAEPGNTVMDQWGISDAKILTQTYTGY